MITPLFGNTLETTPILANKDQKAVSSTNEAENVKEPQDGTTPILQTDEQTFETRQQGENIEHIIWNMF